MSIRLGIAGVHGHGRTHVGRALDLHRRGIAELVAVADPRGPGELPSGVAHVADAAEMIARGGLDAVVLSTPIPTHVALTQAALEAGAHVLLEKPPVVTVADHDAVVGASRRVGLGVQVGFQSLGSDGVGAAADVVASGTIGEIRHVGAVGLWSRSEEYWRRAPWAGHRRVGGRVVADGVVTNPLAHAVATALAIAGAAAPEDVAAVETDLRRANDIEADDTSTVRIELASGIRLLAALVTTAAQRHEPYVLVRGSAGHLVYHYTLDVLHVFCDGAALPRTFQFGRRELLEDLCAHVAEGSPLAVPIDRTGAFTRVLESVVHGPEPVPLAESTWSLRAVGAERFRVVDGIAELAERAAWEGRLFRELDPGL